MKIAINNTVKKRCEVQLIQKMKKEFSYNITKELELLNILVINAGDYN